MWSQGSLYGKKGRWRVRVRDGDMMRKAEVREKDRFEMGCCCFDDGRKNQELKNAGSF